MKVKRVLPEAEKPEEAFLLDGLLCVSYHRFDKDSLHYVDAYTEIPIQGIVEYVMLFGPRKAFKSMTIFYRDIIDRHITEFKLSNHHKQLASSIYKQLKEVNIKPRGEIK